MYPAIYKRNFLTLQIKNPPFELDYIKYYFNISANKLLLIYYLLIGV